MCVPSPLHHQLMFWNEGKLKVVLADQKSFSACVKVAEAMYYTPKFQLITWPPRVTHDAIQAVNFTSQGFKVEIEAEPIKLIGKGDYLENLLSNMLNNDGLSDEL